MTIEYSTDKDDATTAQPINHDELTRFQLDALTVIAGFNTGRYDTTREEPHGLGIKEVLDDRYGTEVHHSRLYSNIDTLIDHGLVEKRELDRRTNSYHLTGDGHSVLDERNEWLADCLDRRGQLTAAAIERAAAENTTVAEVADSLDVTEGTARTLLVNTNNYTAVTEGGR